MFGVHRGVMHGRFLGTLLVLVLSRIDKRYQCIFVAYSKTVQFSADEWAYFIYLLLCRTVYRVRKEAKDGGY